MDLIYETVHFKGSEHLENFTRKKMNCIFHKTKDILRAEVTLSEGASGNIENQYCEIRLSMPGENISVKKNAATYEEAIRAGIEAAQKVIRRRKAMQL